MSTSQQEQLNTQKNVEEQHNSSSSNHLWEREQIHGSPYWINGNIEQGYMITFGKWQLTDKVPSKLDAILYLENNKYDIILKTILCVIDMKLGRTKDEDKTTETNT